MNSSTAALLIQAHILWVPGYTAHSRITSYKFLCYKYSNLAEFPNPDELLQCCISVMFNSHCPWSCSKVQELGNKFWACQLWNEGEGVGIVYRLEYKLSVSPTHCCFCLFVCLFLTFAFMLWLYGMWRMWSLKILTSHKFLYEQLFIYTQICMNICTDM